MYTHTKKKKPNKVGNTAIAVACGCAVAIFEVTTSNGDYRREDKVVTWVTLHQAFVFSHCNFFYLSDQIESNCMYWLHWNSEKNRTGPNDLNELKCSKSINQITNYAHWHAFLYLHAQIKTFIYLSYLNQIKRLS